MRRRRLRNGRRKRPGRAIVPALDREALGGCDFAIEAATERLEVKAEIFRDLDRILRPEVILASNTSSISITKLAAQTSRPRQVIGMHFFNPVPVMQLVEVIRGLQTSQETFETVQTLAVALGKTPVEVNDAAGFISNRVLMPMINEAIFAVMEGVATPEAVDKIFQLGMAHPMGPLDAGRLHRARCLPGYHARAGAGNRRPEVSSLSFADPHGGCRLARSQIRTRILYLHLVAVY